MNCQQICKILRKDLTEVKILQKVWGGYFFSETPFTLLQYILCATTQLDATKVRAVSNIYSYEKCRLHDLECSVISNNESKNKSF